MFLEFGTYLLQFHMNFFGFGRRTQLKMEENKILLFVKNK